MIDLVTDHFYASMNRCYDMTVLTNLYFSIILYQCNTYTCNTIPADNTI